MKKKISVKFLIGAIVLAVILTFDLTYLIVWNAFSDRIDNLAEREANYTKMSEISSYINEYYIGQYDERDLLDGIGRGYTSSLGDAFSYYMPSEEARSHLSTADSKYTGIGIVSCYDEDNKGILILSMPEGSSAKENHLDFLDCITAVDGVPVSVCGYENALEKIRGEEGTDVVLSVYRQYTDEQFDAIVRRGAVVASPGASGRMIDENIGYIRLDDFDEGISKHFIKTYNELMEKGMTGLVIDLRMNPGGYMDEMMEIADFFLDDGKCVYQQIDYDDKIEAFYASSDSETVPMCVLINRYTLGSAEYLASALSENGRAKVIGENSAGVAYAQSSIELSDGSLLVLSTSEYLTPEGKSILNTGYAPDIKIETDFDDIYRNITLTDPDDKPLETAVLELRSAE